MASGARWHHWPMQKGTPERTGYSPHVMPNISKSEAWTWQAEILDIHRATPLIDDQLNVYVTSIAGRSVKFSPDGKKLWSHYTGVERGGVPGVPVIEGDRLLMLSTFGFLISIDLETGAEVWSRKVTQMSDSTTDCLLATQGVVVLSAMDPVVSTLAAGRTQRWNHENNRVLGLSVSDGSVVFKFAPYTTVYNFQASTQHDGSFVFQDVTGAVYRVTLEGKLVWYGGAIDPKSASTAAAVISEGKVYAVCNVGGGMKEGMSEGKGHLHAYDYVTGRKLWWQELPYEGNQAVAVGQLPGAKGLSLVMGMGKNPGIPWFMLVAKILPSWMVPWTYPIYALTLRYPHWFAWPQNRAILAFDAETGDLQWWHELPAYQKLASEGDNEKFLERYQGWTNNPNNEPVCMPDANSQPVIDGAGTAFVPFQDGHVYAVRDANGDGKISPDEVQSHHVGDAFQASLAMAPKMLVALDCQGRLKVFKD
ncbi:unnamed protein product [Durusdinium trenchii]|uniref:Pyrrolo-quinoline quinone repeat domain-containing protein n=1 Tax=Durusdinium trenchii TaxID=1381693 RepID=A0ABP0KGL6_9DINO